MLERFVDALTYWFDVLNASAGRAALASGLLVALWLLSIFKRWPTQVELCLRVSAGVCVLSTIFLVAIRRTPVDAAVGGRLAVHGLVALLAPLAVFLILRVTSPTQDVLKSLFVRRSRLERNRRTDVRSIELHLPTNRKSFDPRRHFRSGKVFIGIGEGKEKISLPLPLRHMQVVGTSGAGKGRLLGALVAQFARAGEFVIVGDPKCDDWLPSVCCNEAKSASVAYNVLDLRPSAPPQFNILDDAATEQVAELLSVAFGLEEEGAGGPDFYKPSDRAAAQLVARAMRSDDTSASLLDRLRDELADKAENFLNRFAELADMPCANGVDGLSLRAMMETGGVLYVVGSMRDPRVRMLQRMLLVRILQLSESRDNIETTPRQVAVILDEAKAWISAPALEFLGAARSKGAHVVLSHQSLADLKTAPGLNPYATVDAVVENCAYKVFYRVQNPETAAWIAAMTGEIQVDDESRVFETGIALTEKVSNTRTVRQARRFLFDENILLNLPDGWAVLTGDGIPKLIQICHVPTEKSREALRVVSCAAHRVSSAGASPI